MNKRRVCIVIFRGDDGKTYIQSDLFDWVEKPELYKSAMFIAGKTALVQVISDDEFSKEEMKDAAIKFMTGRYSQWSFDLRDDEPKWRKVK